MRAQPNRQWARPVSLAALSDVRLADRWPVDGCRRHRDWISGQAFLEVLVMTLVLLVVLWGIGGRGDGALFVLWQAWLLRWQRFAAALALPL